MDKTFKFNLSSDLTQNCNHGQLNQSLHQ